MPYESQYMAWFMNTVHQHALALFPKKQSYIPSALRCPFPCWGRSFCQHSVRAISWNTTLTYDFFEWQLKNPWNSGLSSTSPKENCTVRKKFSDTPKLFSKATVSSFSSSFLKAVTACVIPLFQLKARLLFRWNISKQIQKEKGTKKLKLHEPWRETTFIDNRWR